MRTRMRLAMPGAVLDVDVDVNVNVMTLRGPCGQRFGMPLPSYLASAAYAFCPGHSCGQSLREM